MRKKHLYIMLLTAGAVFTNLAAHCLANAQSAARVFFVDPDRGNDSNTGLSEKHPWKSLAAVSGAVFGPGDQVLFRRGAEFRGELRFSATGSPSQPIRIGAYGKGAKPRIIGRDSSLAAVHLYNSAYIIVSDLDIMNRGGKRLPNRSGIRIEISDFGEANGIQLSNLNIHDVNGSLIKAEGGGAGILVINKGKRRVSVFNDLVIENCTIRRCERNGIIFSSAYYTRDNWHPGKGLVIRGNLLEEIPGDGIVPIGFDGALIEYNVMRKCSDLLPPGEAAAGIWPWSCDNTVVQFNEVSGHKAYWDGQGFDSDYNCRNTLIQYNYSHDNHGGFLLVCDYGSATYPESIGNRGTVVRYNISINDGIRDRRARNGKMFSPVIHLAGPVDSTRLYGNIIYLARKANDSIDHTLVVADSWDGFPSNSFFTKNLFYSEDTAGFRIAPEAKKIQFRENNWYGSFNFSDENGRFAGKPHEMRDPEAVLRDIRQLLKPTKKGGHSVNSRRVRQFLAKEITN